MATKEMPFYNVDGAVGPGCPNKRTDVMLVQFFLHEIYDHPTQKPNKPAGPDIGISGNFDATTAQWILHFQNQVKRIGHRISTDGRVDHAKGEQYTRSSISQTQYTITHMNISYARRFRQQHNQLEAHPRIPGELKTELAQEEQRLR